MRKVLLIVFSIGVILYTGLYCYFYSIQDDRFKSAKLTDDYAFTYSEEFEELNFKSKGGGQINSLLFKADRSKGVICFWKGNGSNLDKWGKVAPQFLSCNYDVIITDYREQGKSKGDITFDNFYSDAQVVYDFLKTRYPEGKIVIVGYSLGAHIASYLTIANRPLMTILIDPREKVSNEYLEIFFLPLPDIIRFPFRTDLDIQKASSPVVIITGTKSDLYRDAIRLNKLLTKKDKFFEIQGANHQTILQTKELDKIFHVLLQ